MNSIGTFILKRLRKSSIARFMYGYKPIQKVYQLVRRDEYLGIPQNLQTREFFEILNSYDVKYVVLRWHDRIYDLNSAEEDIDILINSFDVRVLKKICTTKRFKSRIQIDYSTVDLHGEIHADAYPSKLAYNLINNREYSDGFYKPSKIDYYLSFLFHIVYHKGYRSKVPNIGQFDGTTWTKHLVETSRIVNELSPNAEINLYSLMEILDNYQCSPTESFLIKNKQRNPFIEEVKFRLGSTYKMKPPDGLFILYIRENFIAETDIDKIREIIINSGHQVIEIKTLNIDQKKYAAENIRGGNWPKEEGGQPNKIMVGKLKDFNRCSYINDMGHLKGKIRSKFKKPFGYPVTVVHSADTPELTMYHLEKFYSQKGIQILCHNL